VTFTYVPDAGEEGVGVDRKWPLPQYVPSRAAAVLLEDLERLWAAQTGTVKAAWSRSVLDTATSGAGDDGLRNDLSTMKAWFEPTATGARIRAAIEALPESDPLPDLGDLFFAARPDAALVTPEGRAALWLLRRADAREPFAEADAYVWTDPAETEVATAALMAQYREWSLHRLRTVTELLADETATLRPSAAGLLLVLLVNRNTARERALPRPKDKARQAAISAAIAAPALAYAHALTGTAKAGGVGLDLYRGWALGELVRRLGGGLETGEVIYLRPEAEERAVERLLGDLRRRGPAVRRRFPEALSAALAEYERSRPVLNGLGLAHERPANTSALRAALLAGASAVPDPAPGDG
jgi:hypothetical protein